MIVDEIQTGYGRTGKFWAYEWEGIRPDIIAAGKSMTGGFLPASAAICDAHIMDLIKPGDHGSTYGGNPVAMAVAHAALKTLIEEGMIENADAMGKLLIEGVKSIGSPLFKEVRGRGLFVGIEIRSDSNVDGKDFAKKMFANGLITKATHDTTVRLTPALVINKSEVEQALEIIAKSTKDLEKYNIEKSNKK
jgi:ornithine--oxo-acid transaminase